MPSARGQKLALLLVTAYAGGGGASVRAVRPASTPSLRLAAAPSALLRRSPPPPRARVAAGADDAFELGDGDASADPMEPELSRPFPLARLGARNKPEVVPVVASAAECAAIAARFDVPELHSLVALCTIRRAVGETIAVRGNFTAQLTQACVVSNERFRATIRAEFATILHPDAASLAEGGGLGGAGDAADLALALEASADGEPPIDEELLEDPTSLDLGELVAQYFCLNVDQFPRKPGAVFLGLVDADEDSLGGGFRLGDRWPDTPPGLLGADKKKKNRQ